MSCGTNANLIRKAACRLGISRLAGLSANLGNTSMFPRKTALAGALAVAGLAAAVAVVRSRGAAPETASADIDPRSLPDNPPRPTVKPSIPAPDQPCPGCQAGSDKPGPWYAIGGQHHCADCAPDAARKARVDLAMPDRTREKKETGTGARVETTVTTEGAVTTTRRKITLPEVVSRRPDEVWLAAQPLDVRTFRGDGTPGMVRLEENAFAVFRGDSETGLGVVREPARNGGWCVVLADTGMALAGDMDSVYEAEGLAQLLAPIDWNRPFDEMPQSELEDAGKIIGKYQNEMASIKDRLGPWTQW